MTRLLWNVSHQFKISVADFNGGNLRNAIPREAFSTIVFDKTLLVKIKNWIRDFYATQIDEFGTSKKILKYG